jgi:hypothetical protein
MNQFGKFNVVWKGRANNVERFGDLYARADPKDRLYP